MLNPRLTWFAAPAALFWLVAAATAHATVVPAPSAPTACAITAGVIASCYDLDVSCEQIPARRVRIRQLDVAAGVPVAGNVLFTTGNTGTSVYGAPTAPERIATVMFMHDHGYRTFEVAWLGEEGWQTGAHGVGRRRATCAYAEVVKYLATPLPSGGGKMPEHTLGGLRGQNIRAHGNSGGSAQIAYGLTSYNLEAYLSVAVFSAGPPISDLTGTCFGTLYNRDTNPAGIGVGLDHPVRVITDKALGFYSPSDVAGFNYCANYQRPAGQVGSGVLPPSFDLFDADSLVSKGAAQEARDYSTPFTCQRFVVAEFDSTGAHNQSALYYAKVSANQPARAVTYAVPGLENHETDATAAGATAIRARLVADCFAQPAVIEYRNSMDFADSPGGHFFYTAEPLEQAQLDIGNAGQFERTGAWFAAGGTVPVCRFYGSVTPGPNSHFFTAEQAECDALRAQQLVPTPAAVPQWNYEGPGFLVTLATQDAAGTPSCPANTQPVFRGYNNAFTQAGKQAWDSNHRYATSPAAIDNLVTQFGWRNEGLVFCTPSQ